MPNHCVKVGDNEELTSERRLCPFDTNKLAARIWGDEETIKRRHVIMDYVEKTPELAQRTTDPSFMTRLEQVENVYQGAVLLKKHAPKVCQADNVREFELLRRLLVGEGGYPFGLHNSMTISMLRMNCDDEQRKEWLQKALNVEFVGTYAQTEMAHGTNLKKLETTATYDAARQEFVMHSPTLTSTKWIPGNLGKSTNFVIVMAQLWTQGKCYGPHGFMVQIRDFDTHQPMPGVLVGDIGPKYGYGSNDNGFLRLDRVRIPRRNMLMGHSKVHPDGRFEPPKHSKLAYTAMMFIRSVMIHGQGQYLGMAAVIATRYSCIRRQGEISSGDGEVKILDYQTHQYRVLPQLARAICFCFAGHYSGDLYYQVMDDVNKGDTSLMADLHALNSGLKSVVSFQTSLGIEQCRLGLGGHGYSCASGIPQLFGNSVGGCTYEGENLVMLLQLARYLMKLAPQIKAGKPKIKLTQVTKYLFDGPSSSKRSTLNKGQDRLEQWHAIQAGFEHVSRRLTLRAFRKLDDLKRLQGISHEQAWNKVAIDLSKASKAHTRTFLSRIFIQREAQEKDYAVKIILGDLLQLYLHYELQECRADHLEDGYIGEQQLEFNRAELNDALAKVRVNALSIADSFDFDDRELNSCLGRRDGNVYESLWKYAQQSELNRTQVLPFHHETIGKLMKEAQAKSKL